MAVGKLGHAKSKRAHWDQGDRLGKGGQGPTERLATFSRPRASEPPASSGDNALAQADIEQVGGRGFVDRENRGEAVADLVRQEISEEVIVEDRRCHVVARSGSSARDRTNAACSSRLRTSPSNRRPSPLGTVSTPNPRSRTSTGPPLPRCQRRRAAAGSDICPDDETRYCRRSLTGHILLGKNLLPTR